MEKYMRLMNLIDQGFDLMDEYDSLPHRYGDVTLYQSEAKLIQYIGRHENTTITDIASERGKTISAYSQLIRKLKGKGFVRQTRNEHNAKVYNLSLTEEGWRIFNAHQKFEQACYQRYFQKLEEFSQEELDAFCRVQEKLNEAFALDVQDSYHSQA